MNTTTTTTIAKPYKPCWTHHPRGGKILGYAGKIQKGLYGPERGIALTEKDARNQSFFTQAPASQVFKDEICQAPMTLDHAIKTLEPITLGETITLADCPAIRADIMKNRREFTEEEFPEGLHNERLAAIKTIQSHLSR